MSTAFDVTLRRIDPELNMHRQYRVSVGPDLFGAWVVTCRWGRVGAAGQVKHHACATADEAKDLAQGLVQKRIARGYVELAGKGVTAAVGAISPAATDVPKRPRREASKKRTKAPASGQMSLLDWQAPVPGPTERERLPASPTCAVQVVGQPETVLMRRLGKPATLAERERAMSLLTLAAGLRGLSLGRGSVQRSV